MNAEEYMKYAEQMLREADEYIARGDTVQASEKLYKIVEDGVKMLTELHSQDNTLMNILNEVKNRGA